MRLRYAFTFTITAFVLVSGTAAQAPAVHSTTQRNDPFVSQAEAAYAAHLVAEKTGDVGAYKKYRAREAIEETLADLHKQGKSEKDLPAVLRRVSAHSISLEGFRFIRAERMGNSGRLFYRRDWRKDDLEMVEFFGYVIRLEDGAWKVGCVLNSVGTKIGVGSGGKLQERTVEEVSEHRCLSVK